ncbi:ABC transporter ATP-binding protein [Bacillus sp. HMF5848]|uniref:ABC transporter ATP-binding protein n=1 Tax=Bacillus sp. HMF5848 TaxID=2495421 RepID=UPI000F7A4A60|nr:ABC transporter ATP-binding protein [Bacillus sp. HMF5848]RSK28671.1 ABC transporter ATP-binding protein [Bacillus sp. HMF5848]
MQLIEVKELSKRFILNNNTNTLKDLLVYRNKIKRKEYWALQNVNLSVSKGEAVGIIGRNGSGKSTLLKIITKILYPTSGEVNVHGRVSSLLELGAGFKPDYTGLENIYLNGAILGLSKKQVDEKLKFIIEFSELEEFIDQPVRNYSSGMYMRLAYSIAVSIKPDILLIDEILAVGDKKFKEKGLNHILSLKEQGTTIILVSHSEDMIKKVCDRVIWMDKGMKKADGPVEEVFSKYNA